MRDLFVVGCLFLAPFVILLVVLILRTVFYLLAMPFSVLARVKKIREKNEELRLVEERIAEAKKSGDDKAMGDAIFDWAEISGLVAAAMKRNERRLMCANYPFGPAIGSQRDPYPGILEDIACIFRTLEALRETIIVGIIKKWKLAKMEYPVWA